MIEKKLRNLVLSGYRDTIGKEGKFVYVESDNGRKRFSPKSLEQIILFGEGKITFGAVRYLARENVDIVFIDERHEQFLRIVEGNQNPLNKLWEKQLKLSERDKLKLAKNIVEAALYNKYRLLLQTDTFSKPLEKIKEMVGKTEEISIKEELWGLEGECARIYFHTFSRLIPEKFCFKTRKKHPPPDPVNSMLGYGYTVLKSRIQYALLRANLNPYLGVLHENYRDRPSLAFDLMEIFRPVIVDRVVLTMVRKRMLDINDFHYPRSGVCYISGEGKRSFLNQLYRRMESKHRYKGKNLEFLDIMFLQAKELADAIKKGVDFSPFKYR